MPSWKSLKDAKLDNDFLRWLSFQPSCLTGDWAGLDDSGEPRNIACHVRRAGEAGTAYKPEFSAVPMTDKEHKVQSNLGELMCLQMFLGSEWNDKTVEDAKEWFNAQARRYYAMWLQIN